MTASSGRSLPSDRDDRVLGELVEDFISRLQAGEVIDPSDFAARHPELVSGLVVAEASPARGSDAVVGDVAAAFRRWPVPFPSRDAAVAYFGAEAWANGAPCVGYRAGGVAWVIRHEVDGLLVPCGDVEGLGGVASRENLDKVRRLLQIVGSRCGCWIGHWNAPCIVRRWRAGIALKRA